MSRLRLSLRRRRSRPPRSSGRRWTSARQGIRMRPCPASPSGGSHHQVPPTCPARGLLSAGPTPGMPLPPPPPPPGTPNDPKFRAGAGWPRLTQAERRQRSQRARGPRLCRRGVHGGPLSALRLGRRAAAGAAEDHSGGAGRRGSSRPGSMALASPRFARWPRLSWEAAAAAALRDPAPRDATAWRGRSTAGNRPPGRRRRRLLLLAGSAPPLPQPRRRVSARPGAQEDGGSPGNCCKRRSVATERQAGRQAGKACVPRRRLP